MRFASLCGSKTLPFFGCFHTAQGLLTSHLDVYHAKQLYFCLIYDAITLVQPTQNGLISSLWELQLCDTQHYKIATGDHRMVAWSAVSKQLSIKPIWANEKGSSLCSDEMSTWLLLLRALKKKMKQGSLLVDTFENWKTQLKLRETSLRAQFSKPDGLRFQFAINSMLGWFYYDNDVHPTFHFLETCKHQCVIEPVGHPAARRCVWLQVFPTPDLILI